MLQEEFRHGLRFSQRKVAFVIVAALLQHDDTLAARASSPAMTPPPAPEPITTNISFQGGIFA